MRKSHKPALQILENKGLTRGLADHRNKALPEAMSHGAGEAPVHQLVSSIPPNTALHGISSPTLTDFLLLQTYTAGACAGPVRKDLLKTAKRSLMHKVKHYKVLGDGKALCRHLLIKSDYKPVWVICSTLQKRNRGTEMP